MTRHFSEEDLERILGKPFEDWFQNFITLGPGTAAQKIFLRVLERASLKRNPEIIEDFWTQEPLDELFILP